MQLHRDGARWVLRLDEGQELLATLSELARTHGLRAGIVVSGIGMLRRGRIGYWNGREYEAHELDGPHELVSLHGSIAELDGAPSVHLHVAVAGKDHRLLGGHLLEGTIGIVGELYLESFEGERFGRRFDARANLKLLDLEPAASPP
ncbi:MAG: DNA-binding protein [Thermoplasmata archaeon]|nr:DNA-binding protein [Thermoplasmata archaeon]